MERARVLDYDLQRQITPHMAQIKLLPSIYYLDFVPQAHLRHIRADVRKFKKDNGLDRVVVFWTANTECYSDLIPGVNDTADNILNTIETSHLEVSPSSVFAVAAILEGEPFVNGAPQNTFVPGIIELAEREKSVLTEFLVNAGIKPLSIASYNHLGNNDGHNLSAERQFRSQEISKSSVVDDMVNTNRLLFKAPEEGTEGKGNIPTMSLLSRLPPCYASDSRPILTELLTRVKYHKAETSEFQPLYSVLSLLSYMLKAPLVKPGTEVVNSLNRQRNALDAFLKACIGLEGSSDLLLETRIW
ncbi:uncharacterized protein EV420DRAFT_1751253 [Desarmillaria tabescens]|uniref:Inositol-3-phosphate synthase n=1 Tax=Armillaria tabescens TaxID=1929756 RepID=A0AA39JQM4_ARMTA|nr:uncharacterized protein EV420DRAFT_1751253 [Desarmillaria tabescens]KAK0447008.1 hypothetical protein EV420DRAFT_1751253 [Desarmillaria tabescens]